jgi:glycosyltransferase involved in cell wall biosynthesis
MVVTSGHLRDQRVTACIPYYQCRRHVRRAVQSLLRQTHRNIAVVVVNDGDPEPPWDLLADIRDPRLVRFSLPANHGPFFANAVVLNATSAPYFLIQDADDWSASTRVATLLERLEREGSDLAISAQPQYMENGNGNRLLDIRWATASRDGSPAERFVVRPTLAPEYAYRVPHAGLFRSNSIRRVGGYYGGFRIAYDTLLTNLILMTGRVSHVAQPLYFRLVRPESLTHSPLTGFHSAHARRVQKAIVALYRRCFTWYSKYLAGSLDSRRLGEVIRGSVARNVTAADARQLAVETQRLKQSLRTRRIEPKWIAGHERD